MYQVLIFTFELEKGVYSGLVAFVLMLIWVDKGSKPSLMSSSAFLWYDLYCDVFPHDVELHWSINPFDAYTIPVD